MAGAGDRVRLSVAFAGSLKGTLTLAGRLRFDPQAQCIYATDVSYALETGSAFVRRTNALLRESLRLAVERAARWPVQGTVGKARERLGVALNPSLGEGLALSGKVRTLSPLAVAATPTGLYARVLAEGDVAPQATP